MNTEQLEYGIVRYGTPLYVFDIDILLEETGRIHRYIGENTGLCFAMKANPFLAEQLAAVTDRIEICSMGEYLICKKLNIPPHKMLISGVLKKELDMQQILEDTDGNCLFTVESLKQLDIFARWSQKHQKKLLLLLRLSSGNQFGMDEETLKNIINARHLYPYLEVKGIHYFSGTQKRTLEKVKKELDMLDDFIQTLEKETDFQIEALEYGPGLSVNYFIPTGHPVTHALRADRSKTADDCIDKNNGLIDDESLKELGRHLNSMHWKGHVTLEMGRALTALCGYYLTGIQELKTVNKQHYCIMDGGIHQMNYDGQIKGMYTPYLSVIPQRAETALKEWTICGSLCTSNDVLCQRFCLPQIKSGDVLVFERTGAYSITEGMALFLSHELSAAALYSRRMGWQLVRQKLETYEWNLAGEVTYE